MSSRSHLTRGVRPALWALTLVAGLALGSCDEGAGLGRACTVHDDCVAGLQCVERTCVPRCDFHLDCGDGYRCTSEGTCEVVSSSPGDACTREVDCGAGQACRLDAFDLDDDGQLAATCQLDRAGGVSGSSCDGDEDCRNGNCALGRCLDLCAGSLDCAPSQVCATIPRLLATSNPEFSGCFQGSGTLTVALPVSTERQTVRVPVPSHTTAFTVVTTVDDASQFAGVERIEDPEGTVLFTTPTTVEQYFSQPIRHRPAQEISSISLPNSPELLVKPGTYRFDVSSFDASLLTGTAVPAVTAVYKFDAGTLLDLHFHFLDLGAHPCREFFSTTTITASIASASTEFQSEYLAPLGQILTQAGLSLGEVTYDDISGRADLDALRRSQAGALFELGSYETGVNIFFVRSIEPSGVQAIAGGVPGPTRLANTPASGVAVALDSLCYRQWSVLARSTAHVIGQQLGLYRNVEPDGHQDPISDSDQSTANLMHFSEFGGASLSTGQGFVLRQSAGLR